LRIVFTAPSDVYRPPFSAVVIAHGFLGPRDNVRLMSGNFMIPLDWTQSVTPELR
jgi:hypothetical protein